MTTVQKYPLDSEYDRVEKLRIRITKMKEMRQHAGEKLQTIDKGDTSEVEALLINIDLRINMLEEKFERYIHGKKYIVRIQ